MSYREITKTPSYLFSSTLNRVGKHRERKRGGGGQKDSSSTPTLAILLFTPSLSEEMPPSTARMGAESRCNEYSSGGRRSSTPDAWSSCGRGSSSWRKQETDGQRRRDGRSIRRRRRTLCAVSAVIAGYAAASLPCGAGFVAPGVQQAGRSAAAVPSCVRSAAPVGGETRRAGMRRRRPSDAVHMVRRGPILRGRWCVSVLVLPKHMIVYAHVRAVSSPSTLLSALVETCLFFYRSFSCLEKNTRGVFLKILSFKVQIFNPPCPSPIISHESMHSFMCVSPP